MTDNLKTYRWTGINTAGKRLSGVLQASDIKQATGELRNKGIEVIKLQPAEAFSLPKLSLLKKRNKIKNNDILLFTRYLSTLLTAGLPIIQALDIIGHDQTNPNLQSLIMTIKTNIASGKTLAESFSQYPQHFSELYCNLIKAGEKSGTLDKILRRLTHYLERTENLKRKIRKALIYPIAILTVAMSVSLILLIFVVPQFQQMFSSFGAQLPYFTRLVVGLSDFVRSYWWLLLIIGIGLVLLLRHAFKTSAKAQELKDKYILKTYLIGPVLQKSIIARFTRTLATTLEAGMPIMESMNTMVNIMGNQIYSRAVVQIRDDLISGNQLSFSMGTTKLFPNMAVQMINVGEVAGSLPEMLNKVADHYEEEVNTIVDNLSSLMEPLIMIILGVIVGGFVVAMYLPIFRIGSLF